MATAEPRAFDGEGLRIIVDSDWGTRLGPGYLPVRLDLTNLADPRTITVSGQSTRYPRYGGLGYQPSRLVAERTIRMARGARVQFTLSLPISADSENLVLTIRQDREVLQSVGIGTVQSNQAVGATAVLLVAPRKTSAGVDPPAWTIPSREAPLASGFRGMGGKLPIIDFALEPQRLPTSWVSYSALRAVVIGGPEWRELTDDQRAGLRKWTACGGDLIVVDGDPAALLAPGIALASSDGARSTLPYLLGHVHRVPSAEIASGGLEALLGLLPAIRTASWRLPVNRASDWTLKVDQGFRLRMAGIGDVHTRGYLTLLMVFALLIGPVNYVFLRNRGLQWLIVLTAPVIATVFLVLLAFYVVVGEGFGVHVRAATLTVLDQERQEAVTRADVSLYPAGRTPGGGLRFSSETAVLAFNPPERGDVHVDLADGQRFDDGFVRARTPLNFETIEWRQARERLTFSRESGALKVSNGLGSTVTHLFVRSESGAFELSTPVTPGGQALLHAWVKEPVLIPLSHPLYPRYYEVMASQPLHSYVAIVDKAPSWDPGVAGAVEHDSAHIVLGLLGQLP
jgi:hypothetical protein